MWISVSTISTAFLLFRLAHSEAGTHSLKNREIYDLNKFSVCFNMCVCIVYILTKRYTFFVKAVPNMQIVRVSENECGKVFPKTLSAIYYLKTSRWRYNVNITFINGFSFSFSVLPVFTIWCINMYNVLQCEIVWRWKKGLLLLRHLEGSNIDLALNFCIVSITTL